MESTKKFRITYTKWLQTHSRSHEEYQRRKRFNWGIISKIDFNPIPLKKNQIIFTKSESEGKYLGTVKIIRHEEDFYLKRYTYIINIEDNLLKKFQFKVIFTFDGLPITIFQLNDPLKEIKKKLLDGEMIDKSLVISSNDKKDLLVDLVEFLLSIKTNLPFEKYQKFSYEEISKTIFPVLKEYDKKKMKQNYIIEFSINKTYWILVNIQANKALSNGVMLSTQCKKLTSLYLEGPVQNTETLPENVEVLSVFEFFRNQSNLDLYKSFSELQNL